MTSYTKIIWKPPNLGRLLVGSWVETAGTNPDMPTEAVCREIVRDFTAEGVSLNSELGLATVQERDEGGVSAGLWGSALF